jgi:hypothetical protein
MKRLWLISLAAGLAIQPLIAKINVDLFGYYEFQASGSLSKNTFLQLYSNKLRVDLKSDLSDTITFAGNFNLQTYHGTTEWNILDFLPDEAVAEVPEGLEAAYVFNFSHRYHLDNAWVRIAFKPFDLIVGKQQLSFGTGYVWNPTDVFNVKDYLDPTYEQPGHNAIRFDIPLGNILTLSVLYAPEDTWKDSARLVRLKGRIWRFDLALIAIEKRWVYHDYTEFDEETGYFKANSERRRLLGLSTAGEIFGVGVWAEYAHNWMEVSDDFYELVVGADYTFDFQTYVMVEFYRNTLGRGEGEGYSLNDWMRLMAQEQKAVCRDQLYAIVQHPVGDFLSLGMSTVASLTDGSMALIPTATYNLSDNIEVMAYFNFNTGGEGTAYARIFGSGGMVRVRVYF